MAPGNVSFTGDRAQGADSKQCAYIFIIIVVFVFVVDVVVVVVTIVSFNFIWLVSVHKLHTCTEMFLGSMGQCMKVWSEMFRFFCENFIFAE